MFGAMISRKWVTTYGVRIMLKSSVYVFAAATLLLYMILYLHHVNLLILWITITVYLLGIGLILPNATACALDPFPQVAGFSASIAGTAQIAFSSLMSSIAATFYTKTLMSMTVLLATAGTLTVLAYLFGHLLLNRRLACQPAEEA
jgi:DHA1 family bicyclomycin/chloramphenicol resistance-like MFS transporter